MHRLFAFTTLLVLLTACDETPGFKDWGTNDPDAALDDLRPPFKWPEAGDTSSPDVSVPSTDRCIGATALTFSGGKASASGTTATASNEYGNAIRCGETAALSGPQRYYKIPMTKGTTYRLELSPQFTAAFYLFTDCSKNIINTDCTSGGATGLFSGAAAAGSTTTATFTAPATGSFRLAVDSTGATGGTFKLTVTQLSTPTHGTCLSAKSLTLVSGKVSLKGTTLGSKNENSKQIGCGLGVDFDGPQVYYSVSLQSATWYRFSLSPDFPASLYVFNSAGTCKAANIEADCGGISGTVLPLVSKGTTGATAFRPLSSGTYLVAVDALDPKAWGDFGLAIESFTPPGNMTCSKATALTLVGGKASVTGTTAGLLNDLGAHVTCGTGPPLVAPQAYYTVALEQKSYQLALKAPFAAVAAVGSSCLTMAADCGSSGLSGTFLKVVPKVTGTMLFTPLKAGTYTVAVDGTTQGAKGAFELWIQEYKKPTNGSCAKPTALVLGGSPTVELGSTGPLKNDLASVSCGTTLGPWTGPQAYYQVSLKKGRTYTVTLSPETSFDPALYAFEASTSCTNAAVNTACKGQASDKIGGGLQETITLAPANDTTVVLVVDSWSPSEVGTYSLSISWK